MHPNGIRLLASIMFCIVLCFVLILKSWEVKPSIKASEKEAQYAVEYEAIIFSYPSATHIKNIKRYYTYPGYLELILEDGSHATIYGNVMIKEYKVIKDSK